jgi:hypothetical protein
MSRTSTPVAETEPEGRHGCVARPRSVAFLELIITAALALSTAVAATAVSIGMARAGVSASSAGGESSAFAVALVVACLLWAAPTLGALMAARQRPN